MEISEIHSNGHGLAPRAIMTDTNLSIEAKALYCYLSYYVGNGNYNWPTIDQISKDLRCSDKRIKRHLLKLERKGYLIVDRKLFVKNNYHLKF